jgi:hypothetical protein
MKTKQSESGRIKRTAVQPLRKDSIRAAKGGGDLTPVSRRTAIGGGDLASVAKMAKGGGDL